jgi:hypothetical protein
MVLRANSTAPHGSPFEKKMGSRIAVAELSSGSLETYVSTKSKRRETNEALSKNRTRISP